MKEISKDYSTISPSAAFLIQLKAYTAIPFAKEAASLLEEADPRMAAYIRQNGIAAFARWLIHFENRYRSVEKLLSGAPAKNILEISSGYSFRGLSLVMDQAIHFIDTDLPDLVAVKNKMIGKLRSETSAPLKGTLELLPLNALDEKEFRSITDRFAEGPLTIINEGLLMYLAEPEKIKICSLIHAVLKQRGGRWITADIYIRNEGREHDILDENEETRRFREQHRIEENKFDSFEAAEEFFKSAGFKITAKETWVLQELSCLQLFPEPQRTNIIAKLKNSSPDRQTWELEAF